MKYKYKYLQVGGGFKEDDAVWKEPDQPKNDQLPVVKVQAAFCFIENICNIHMYSIYI